MWEFYGPPALLLIVSILYFVLDRRDTPMRLRLATSSHGAIAFVLFLVGYLVGALLRGGYRPYLAWPYLLSFLVPLCFAFYALWKYRGPRLLHVLQGPNIAAMLWVMFVGGMAITGDWL